MGINKMEIIIAVDPGDKHVGIAHWTGLEPKKWAAITVTAETALYHIKNLLKKDGWTTKTIIVESFVLYPDKAKAQSWSPMLTSEMIGAIKYIAQALGATIVEQGAYIKNPTRKQLKARTIETLPGTNVHAKDAELHLFHYLLKNDKADFRKQPIEKVTCIQNQNK